MDFREYSLMGEIMFHVRFLQQGLREYKLPYECIVKETAHECLAVEIIRIGEQTASFKRAFSFDMAISWLESVLSQLGRIHLLLAAEEEYLDLAVKRCKKLYHRGLVDTSEYMIAKRLANQVFAKDDITLDSTRDSYNVIDIHGITTTRAAANVMEKILENTLYPARYQ